MFLGRMGGRAAQAAERAMPEESATPDLVELTRRAMESRAAWTADPGRSPGGLDAPLSFFGPDSVWDMSQLGMGELKGSEAIGAFFEEWSEAYEDHQFELEEIDDLGHGVILAVAHQRGRPRGSTGHVEVRWASITEWAGGRIARVTHYTDIDEARVAAERLAQERGSAVPRENLEIVREMYEAFNRGDAEAGLRLLHPEPELHQDPEVVDAETYIGLDAFVRGMTLFTDEWDNPRLEPQDVDAIGDFVFMRVRVSGVAKATRLEMTTQFFHVWTFRDRKPWRCIVRSTREEALRAVGLAA